MCKRPNSTQTRAEEVNMRKHPTPRPRVSRPPRRRYTAEASPPRSLVERAMSAAKVARAVTAIAKAIETLVEAVR